MSRLEEIIKKSLKKDRAGLKHSRNCPAELELAGYLDGVSSYAQRKKIEEHLADCGLCLDLLAAAREVLKKEKKKKAVWLGVLKKQKWLILTIISFSLSFIIGRYFLQFLFLSLILGIKWALGPEGSRNLVMIFRSLQHQSSPDRETPEKIFERK